MNVVLNLSFDDEKGVTCKRCMLSFSKGERNHCAALGIRPICPEEGCRKDCPLKPVNLKNNEDYICATRITVKNSNYGWIAWCDWISGNIAEEGNIEGMIATRYYEASLTEAIDHVLEFMNKMGVKRSDEIEMEGILGFDLYYEEDDEDTLSEELQKVIKEEAEKRKWRCIIEH